MGLFLGRPISDRFFEFLDIRSRGLDHATLDKDSLRINIKVRLLNIISII